MRCGSILSRRTSTGHLSYSWPKVLGEKNFSTSGGNTKVMRVHDQFDLNESVYRIGRVWPSAINWLQYKRLHIRTIIFISVS